MTRDVSDADLQEMTVIPTDRPLVYVCRAGHRMRYSTKGYRHTDPDAQDDCPEPCVGAVPKPDPIRPTLTLIKGGKS